MEALLEALTRFGLPGVVVAIFVFLYVQKDRELKRERDARIEDAKAMTKVVVQMQEDFNKRALELQDKAIQTANRLSDVFEELKNRYPRRSA
jgi:chemotaxis regulatin CheY-phosphate phosphatase CheZ